MEYVTQYVSVMFKVCYVYNSEANFVTLT